MNIEEELRCKKMEKGEMIENFLRLRINGIW